MNNQQLNVLSKFETMQKQLKQRGRLWDSWPCDELYNKCSGVIPWKVYTIWAYSNVWKSKFAYWHIAYFLKQGKKVLIVNLEVDAAHCFMNILQAVNKLNYKEVMDYKLTDDDIDFYSNLTITDDLYKLDDIVNKIESEHYDIVFIDFVQNIEWKWMWDYEKNATVAKTIQRTAIKTGSTIYSLSQLSNSVGKDVFYGNTDFISLKWSWEYYASSDVIFILARNDNEMIVKISKNKYGRNGGEFAFDVDFARNQFTFKRTNDGLDE